MTPMNTMTPMTMTDLDARFESRLRTFAFSNIDAKPQAFDTSEGYPERWDYLEAAQCSDCGKIGFPRGSEACDGVRAHAYEIDGVIVSVATRDARVAALDDAYPAWAAQRCEGYLTTVEGPMMNVLWPLDEITDASGDVTDLADLAIKLVHLPVCIVTTAERDEHFLALTGGGMDLTWELVHAYVALELLPPVALSNLPRDAGRRATGSTLLAVAALRRSVQCMRDRMDYKLEGLEHTVAQLEPAR